MTDLKLLLRRSVLAGGVLLLGMTQVLAQAPYPQRPVTLVVGYPPGGSTDQVARTLGQELSTVLGQPVVIENLGGAGGSLAAQKVASAVPDGYTLLVGANNEIAINALVRKSVRYGTGDFKPLGLLSSQPLVLTTGAQTGIKDAAAFLAAAKAKPDQYSYGSSGVGTSLHMAGEMIKQQGGVSLTHIPYRGTGPLSSDLIGGSIEFGVYALSSALPLIKSGKLIALGTTERKRSPVTPDIPALAETPALEGVDVSVWFMLMGPKGLPDPVVARLKSALADVLKAPAYRGKMEASGSVVPSIQPDLAQFLAEETEKYRKIVEFAKIKEE